VVAINQFLEELRPLNLAILRDFQFSALFLSAYRYSFDIWYIAKMQNQDTDHV
jgi:hypothetical protein